MIPDITTTATLLAIWAMLGYLFGSIPFGMLIARVFNLGDLRKIGSGNIGATNVLRTGSKLGAFLTLILDAGKAGIIVLIARAVAAEDAAQIAGFAAFFGHCYSAFLKFRGGKGVATFFGLLFALVWPIGLISGAIWLATAAIFRMSSLAAIVTAAATPVAMYFWGSRETIVLAIGLLIVILWRHKSNIARILNGSESKIGSSKKTT